MTETQRTLLVAMFLVAIGPALFAGAILSDGPASRTVWTVAVVSILASLGSLGLLLWGFLRKDLVPDEIRRIDKNPFDAGGLQFTFRPLQEGERFWVQVWVQNNRDQPCLASIRLDTVKPLFREKPSNPGLAFQGLALPAAGFGMVACPFPVPFDHQGKTMEFEAAAKVEFPQGKGRLVRFHPGIRARSWSGAREAAFGAAATLTGNGYKDKCRIRLELPLGILPENLSGEAPKFILISTDGNASRAG